MGSLRGQVFPSKDRIARAKIRAYRSCQLLLLLEILTIFLVSACSNKNSPNSAVGEVRSRFLDCRMIQHQIGETCVPANPERVIVLDSSALDAAFALGVKPIGSIQLENYLSYPENKLNG